MRLRIFSLFLMVSGWHLIIVNSCDDQCGLTVGINQLQESMIVRDELFAAGAEIEVFANWALVTSSNDREDSTTVTFMFIMSDMRIIGLNIINHADNLSESMLRLLIHLFLDILLHTLNEAKGKSLSLGHLLEFRLWRCVNHELGLGDAAFLLYFFIK